MYYIVALQTIKFHIQRVFSYHNLLGIANTQQALSLEDKCTLFTLVGYFEVSLLIDRLHNRVL